MNPKGESDYTYVPVLQKKCTECFVYDFRTLDSCLQMSGQSLCIIVTLFHSVLFETDCEFCSLTLNMSIDFENIFLMEYNKSQANCCSLVLNKIDL